jgi:UDP-N-acetylglucosamine 4-epimerase
MGIEDIEKRVLVTGGGGFIGSRLVKALLQKGLAVKVLDTQLGLLKEETNPRLEFVGIGSSDLRGGMVDKDLVEQTVKDVDAIYHLAINWDGFTWGHSLPVSDLFDVNIRGTLNLLEAAKSQEVQHFLYSSSVAAYGETKSLVLDEETVCKPELWSGDPGPAYAILKLTIEKLCLMYFHHYGLPVTAFRIEVVFDDNEVQFLGRRIIEDIVKGEIMEVIEGDGFATIHVDEIVQAFLIATLNKNAYGQVFNLSNPATYMTTRELYQLLIELTGSRSEIKLMTDLMYRRNSSPPESIEKIQRMLGWQPQKTKDDVKGAIAKYARSILTPS